MIKIRSRIEYRISLLYSKAEKLLFRRTSLFTKKNSLLFLKVDSIGDYILVRNFIQIIKESDKYRNHKITLCGNSWWKDLSENLDSKYVNEFIWIDYDRIQKDNLYRFRKYLKLFTSGFQTLIHPTYSRDIVGDNIVKHSGAKYKIGFDGDYMNLPEAIRKNNDRSYTLLIKSKPGIEFEFNRDKEFFQEVLGTKTSLNRPIMPVNNPTDEYIVICPGAKNHFRRWAPVNFAKLCNLLTNIHKGDFIICGSKQDSEIASEIMKGSSLKYIDYTGKRSLYQMVEIFEKAKLIITNDSGPMHIAFAMNKNVVGISSGYHYGRFQPYPDEMNLNGTCIYPKEVMEMVKLPDGEDKLNKEEFALDINTISPADVYALIISKYFK